MEDRCALHKEKGLVRDKAGNAETLFALFENIVKFRSLAFQNKTISTNTTPTEKCLTSGFWSELNAALHSKIARSFLIIPILQDSNILAEALLEYLYSKRPNTTSKVPYRLISVSVFKASC